MAEKKQRILVYENLKFILMFLVVLGHVVENLYSSDRQGYRIIFFAIYFFHMPAFIFLSGLMQRVDARLNFRRIMGFVVLGYVYKLFVTLTVGIGSGEWHFSLLKENGIPWFMFALALYSIIAYLVKNIDPKFVLITSVILGCAMGFDKFLADGFLTLNRVMVYLPFYMLGCYLDAEQLMDFCKKKRIKILSVLCILGYCCVMVIGIDKLYNMRHIVTGRNPYNEWALAHGHMILRLGCYIGALFMIIALISLVPNKKLPVISDGGGRTLAIYFWHQNIIKVLIYSGAGAMIVELFDRSMAAAFVISAALTLILSRKCFSVPINYLLKGIFKDK